MRRKKLSYPYYIVVLLLLVIVPYTRNAIGSGIKFITKPIMSSLAERGSAHFGFFSGILNIRNLSNENEELSSKLKKSIVDQVELNELRVENDSLKKQIGYSEDGQSEGLIPAKIIGRDLASFMDFIIVDKGSDDGSAVGEAVLSQGILVGRVSEVWKNQSKVILVTSKDSIVQAMLQSSRAMGVLKGGLSGITLENIPQDSEVATDEIVITSGLGGGIKQGIAIGTISGQKSGNAEIFKVFSVKPLIDSNKLELVFIQKKL